MRFQVRNGMECSSKKAGCDRCFGIDSESGEVVERGDLLWRGWEDERDFTLESSSRVMGISLWKRWVAEWGSFRSGRDEWWGRSGPTILLLWSGPQYCRLEMIAPENLRSMDSDWPLWKLVDFEPGFPVPEELKAGGLANPGLTVALAPETRVKISVEAENDSYK